MERIDHEALAAADEAGFTCEGGVRIQIFDVHSGEMILERGFEP